MDIITALENIDYVKILLTLAGLLLVVLTFYFLFRRLVRRSLQGLRNLGNHLIDRFFRGLSQIETHDEEKPKSLPKLETMLLPQVLKDFPDFDLAMAKNQVKDSLMETYGKFPQFRIHNIVLAEYHKTSLKRSLTFYAALCWRQERLIQKRLAVTMEFQCVKDKRNPAVNCPNCGATLGFGDLECPYCGTRINDRRDQEWAFDSVREV